MDLSFAITDGSVTNVSGLPCARPNRQRRLQTVFASRVQALPASAYDLLLLAVLDGTGDLRLVRALAADREGQGLESAERAGLVRAGESTARLAFPPPAHQSERFRGNVSIQADARSDENLAGDEHRAAQRIAIRRQNGA